MPSAPAQTQPLQDQTRQQGIGSITPSTSVESVLHSFPKSSDSFEIRWTDENIAELEKELRLALGEQQVESSSARASTFPSPRSAEATQDEIQSRERSETTGSRPATDLEIDKHRFRLRGIRTQQLPGRQTKTTQYRVVWGEHPNRSDSWVNEDDLPGMTSLRLPQTHQDRDDTAYNLDFK